MISDQFLTSIIAGQEPRAVSLLYCLDRLVLRVANSVKESTDSSFSGDDKPIREQNVDPAIKTKLVRLPLPLFLIRAALQHAGNQGPQKWHLLKDRLMKRISNSRSSATQYNMEIEQLRNNSTLMNQWY